MSSASPTRIRRLGRAGCPAMLIFSPLQGRCDSDRVLNRHAMSSQMSSRIASGGKGVGRVFCLSTFEETEKPSRPLFSIFESGYCTAKQENLPAPPVLPRFSWLHPRDGCAEFHELLPPPCLSECPSCAVPMALLVQLLHV